MRMKHDVNKIGVQLTANRFKYNKNLKSKLTDIPMRGAPPLYSFGQQRVAEPEGCRGERCWY